MARREVPCLLRMLAGRAGDSEDSAGATGEIAWYRIEKVGATGLEPVTFSMSRKRASQLRQAPHTLSKPRWPVAAATAPANPGCTPE